MSRDRRRIRDILRTESDLRPVSRSNRNKSRAGSRATDRDGKISRNGKDNKKVLRSTSRNKTDRDLESDLSDYGSKKRSRTPNSGRTPRSSARLDSTRNKRPVSRQVTRSPSVNEVRPRKTSSRARSRLESNTESDTEVSHRSATLNSRNSTRKNSNDSTDHEKKRSKKKKSKRKDRSADSSPSTESSSEEEGTCELCQLAKKERKPLAIIDAEAEDNVPKPEAETTPVLETQKEDNKQKVKDKKKKKSKKTQRNREDKEDHHAVLDEFVSKSKETKRGQTKNK